MHPSSAALKLVARGFEQFSLWSGASGSTKDPGLQGTLAMSSSKYQDFCSLLWLNNIPS